MTNVKVTDQEYHPLGLRALLYESSAYAQPRGGLVCIHGGAWVSGDRFATDRIARFIAEQGYAVLSIDFRQGAAHPYPHALHDIDYAMRWLVNKLPDLASEVGLLGISSGGHLALMCAVHPEIADCTSVFQPPPVTKQISPTYVVTCSGVLDPLARYQMARAAGHADIIACHDQYFGGAEVMREASLSSLECVPNGVGPMTFFQGTEDVRLPEETASTAASVLRGLGVKAEAVSLPGLGHATSEWPEAALTKVLRAIEASTAGRVHQSA